MRIAMFIVLGVISAALVMCALVARSSRKPMGADVALLLAALTPPVIGNAIIIGSSDWVIANIGCYLYSVGMDFGVLALLRFTTDYCRISYQGTGVQGVVFALIGFDVAQMLLNPLTGLTFVTHAITIEGMAYHALIPLVGQIVHRAILYSLFFVSVGVFAYKTATAPRIYIERYAVILVVMVFTGAWETFYILSGTPIDRSMIGFGVFGLLIFYFALYYKPMRLLDRMLARIVSDMSEAVFFFDRDGTPIYANEAARAQFAITDDESLKQSLEAIGSTLGVDPAKLRTAEPHTHTTGAGASRRSWIVHYHAMNDERGRRVGSSLTIRDNTEEEERLLREKHLANHDRLTDLYNKERLYQRVAETLDEHPGTGYQIAALDIKDFKLVNDIYGKDAGDQVLLFIAERMRDFATHGEVYGRLSGDKFGFLIPSDEFNLAFVENWLGSYDFSAYGIKQPIVMHMGIFDVTDRRIPVSVMFDRAFMAIRSIKNSYQTHIAYYDDEMREIALWNTKISAELDHALRDGQIQPYLQPLVDDKGKIVGAEVLARWIHPETGYLSPAKFIPCFEENGRIAQLDMHMWECACQILKDWEQRGIDLFLSVNISPKDFYFTDVYRDITDLVTRYGVNPAKLRLEITEAVMMNDIDNRVRIIENLRSHGFLLEMDDFGSGYSSLNMLKDIPVDILKIDMVFLYQTRDRERAQTILRSIIDLSRSLGMPSITEGVETEQQLAMLTHMGCSLFQGYYFAKPMPLSDFEDAYCPSNMHDA